MTALRPLSFAAIGIALAFAAQALALPSLLVVLAGGVAAVWLGIGLYCALTGRVSPL